MRNVRSLLAAALLFGASESARAVDEVTFWENQLLDTIRALQGNAGSPGRISRLCAMLHLAQYDAIMSVVGTYEPYLVDYPADPNTSLDAAAACAAHDILAGVDPLRESTYHDLLEVRLALVPEGAAKANGILLGQFVAQEYLNVRGQDGWNVLIPYVPGSNPGDWRPTWPDYGAALTPHWGLVTPFGLTSGDQFRAPLPLPLESLQYAQEFNEAKVLGARDSQVRTEEQTQIAWFWANDISNTYKPPGHLLRQAEILANQFGLDMVARSRLFALVSMGMADTGIACWDVKYDTPVDLWRPITGIQLADTDGNPDTDADPAWEPLNHFTPPFPAYSSGHASFGAVTAAIFRHYFGTDFVTFTLDTDDPHVPGLSRTFTSFSQAALENGRSRIYLGVHWQQDADASYDLGTAVGDWTFMNFLRPATTEVSDQHRADQAALQLIWPNPSTSTTTFRFYSPSATRFGAAVYDATGRLVRRLVDGPMAAGSREVQWDGQGVDAEPVPAGVYFIRGTIDGTIGSPVQLSGKFIVTR